MNNTKLKKEKEILSQISTQELVKELLERDLLQIKKNEKGNIEGYYLAKKLITYYDKLLVKEFKLTDAFSQIKNFLDSGENNPKS